jgi:hypothetical protein
MVFIASGLLSTRWAMWSLTVRKKQERGDLEVVMLKL